MTEVLQAFHFLRPEWFYALIPAVLLFLLMQYRKGHATTWEKSIDPEFLNYLLDSHTGKQGTGALWILLVAWLLGVTAMAGPVWEKTPQPIAEREDALVIVFDLTWSMYATDVKPNRLVRAKRKLQDLLATRAEGVTGLIVFAGDAHTVSPLTDDTNTIASMIPALEPEIMPAPGSELAPALGRAVELFEDAGVTSGRILIMTDEIRDIAAAQSVARENRFAYPVSVISVGTTAGAPVPINSFNQGYLKDASGNLVIPKVDVGSLREFARVAGGRYSQMTLADEDLSYLLAEEPLRADEEFREIDRDFDIWHEEGPWLLLFLLPLAALAFRRGWLWCLALLITMPVDQAHANLWDDLWQTPDQQGVQALESGEPARAAELFESEGWKGTAHYRTGSYDEAANRFAGVKSSDGRYNLGNALARQGQYEEAIDAYAQALEMNPANEDAAFNKQLVEDLLAQQQQEQQDQQQDGEDGEDSEPQDQNADDQQQSQDEQNQDQAGNEQQQQQNEQQDQQQQQQAEEQEQADQPSQQQIAEDSAELDEEERQALQQWLRRVPDDPGGLLRRKFEKQYNDRMREGSISRGDAERNW